MHKEHVSQLVFSPDGSRLAVDIFNAPLGLWDIATGRQLKTLSKSGSLAGKFEFLKTVKPLFIRLYLTELSYGMLLLGHYVPHLAKVKRNKCLNILSRCQKFVGASSDGTIRFWDANTGEELSVLTTGHIQGLNALAFSSDSNSLAVGYAKTVQLWDTNTFTPRSETTESTDKLITLVFSPDGRTVTSAGKFHIHKTKRDEFRKESVKGELSLWDANTGQNLSISPIESYKGEAPVLPGQREVSSTSQAMAGYTSIVDVKLSKRY